MNASPADAPAPASAAAAPRTPPTATESPSPLAHSIAAVFAAGGPLAAAQASYASRDGQLRMAQAVGRAIERSEPLLVEAGTGVGKTFAYLVPLLLAGRRALVSTATKNLQDQLYLRDLPRLREALHIPATTALLKGRASYLCRHRLAQADADAAFSPRHLQRALARVRVWAQGTASGDLGEIEGVADHPMLHAAISSTRENCLGSDCPEWGACHVMKARREALAADIVVINHHLFFADLALKDTAAAELLPAAQVVVFDEAHQMIDAGVQFLGHQLGTGLLLDYARDLLACGLAQAGGLTQWAELAGACEDAARRLRLAAATGLADLGASTKRAWDEVAMQPAFTAALEALGAALAAARDALAALDGATPDFVRLHERAGELIAALARFDTPVPADRVRWAELTTHQVRLVDAPLDIRESLTAQREASSRAWVFTSATLGDDAELRWFADATGLDAAPKLVVPSPFDYPAHARVYVPPRFPKPAEGAAHLAAVARAGAHCARLLGGRTFVLTTTLRAVDMVARDIAKHLADHVADHLRASQAPMAEPLRVLAQGQAGKRALLDDFARGGAVLVGSHSFWEGIDMPGDALECVLIDKLPFPPPNDPWVQARVRQLEAQGRNAFMDYFVAEAAIALKQGAGRLIRSETDHGLLMICDPRLIGSRYGARLLAALPPMPLLEDGRATQTWLLTLAARH